MAVVTWKQTFIGASILFLIGLIVATFFCYAHAAINSIEAGLSGPFDCTYMWTETRSITCVEKTNTPGVTYTMPGDCKYILVSFREYGINATRTTPRPIKLSLSYHYEKQDWITPHERLYKDEWEIELGKCSANYCGNYRFKEKDDKTKYLNDPRLIEDVGLDGLKRNDQIKCFLNLDRPGDGAYFKLNSDVAFPEDRIFRWYEGWMILSGAFGLSLALIIYIVVMFFRSRRLPKAAQQLPKPFEPPGLFAPVRTLVSHPPSTYDLSTESADEEADKLNHV